MKPTAVLSCGLVLATARLASAFLAPTAGAIARQQRQLQHVTASSQALQANRSQVPNMSIRDGGAEEGRRGGTGVFLEGVKTAVASAAIGIALAAPMLSLPSVAGAADKRMIGEISASGLVFKDKLNVEAFSDPKIKGVTLYLSDFSRPVADKILNGDVFSDPSSASMTCVRSGPMVVGDGINTSKEGEELIKEDKSFFKSIVVRRLYDKEANNVVYVSYASKLDTNADGNKSRFKSSLCALHVE